ncbi:MAG: hypothetical protein ACRC7V_01445 [Lachnospiraceae bacterium]
MENSIELNKNTKIQPVYDANVLIELSNDLLAEVRVNINSKNTVILPIAELATLGVGISSLVPSFNTVTQTTTIATEGLFRIANAAVGDTLKYSTKTGNAWGALKTATGGSKLVQLAEAGPLSVRTQTATAFNPATIMMAAALYSIEKQLGEIVETQKQIVFHLEIKDEANVEGELETLTEIINNYKYNWDNQVYVQSSHKMVMDIKRKARSNMLAYQKKVVEIVSTKKFLVAQYQVNSISSDLEKKFKYYRLSLYTFSMASLMEIMIGCNYAEEYIEGIKEEIKKMSDNYRELFEKSSLFLEKVQTSAVEANVLKGIGTAGKNVGKFIGNIPLAKEGPVDEFLLDSGAHLKKSVMKMEKKIVHQFAALSNPGTRVFVEKMESIIQIYNHTAQICFDSKHIYLIAK